MEYFDKYWVGSVGLSNICVGDLKFRTNNHIEAANGKLGRLMRKHPTIYSFLKGILVYTESAYAELKSNSVPSDRSRFSYNHKKHVESLINDELNLEEFLCLSFSTDP